MLATLYTWLCLESVSGT